jgi:hypothetical protein
MDPTAIELESRATHGDCIKAFDQQHGLVADQQVPNQVFKSI